MPLGEAMYVLMKGSVLLDNRRVESRAVIGAAAIDPSQCSETDCVTEFAATFIRLTRFDYEQSLLSANKFEQLLSMQLLITAPFFSTLSEVKLRRACSCLEERRYAKGRSIYRCGDTATEMYVVKDGEVSLQFPVSVNQNNRWPVGNRQWEVEQIRMKYNLQLKVCRRGDCFGASELADAEERQMSALVAKDCTVYCLGAAQFAELFTPKEVEALKDAEYISIPPKKKMGEEVLKQLKADRVKKEALVSIVQVDAQNLDARESFLSRRTKKMKKWVKDLSQRTQAEAEKSRESVISVQRKRMVIGPTALSSSEYDSCQ